MRLGTQYVVLIVALLGAAMLGAVGLNHHALSTSLDKRQQDWAGTLARSLSEGLARDIIDERQLRLREVLVRIADENADLSYAYVTDFDGRVLAHSFHDGFPRALLPSAHGPEVEERHEHVHEIDNVPVKEVAFPIVAGMKAQLYLGISQKGDARMLSRLSAQFALLALGLGLVGAALSVWLGQRIARPLQQLSDSVALYGATGAAPAIVDARNCTEAQQLQASFLKMTGDRIQALQAVQHSERELMVLNETLEARVLERTAEVSASRDEAERANAAKSEFLSRMSHELRTPLNAILGFGQLLETDPEHPLIADQIDNVHEILHAGGHLLELVNEVLDLAHIESGQLYLILEPVALAPIIESVVAEIQPRAEQRRITLNMEQSSFGTVLADRLRLQTVLNNLLSNAVKYNRERGEILLRCAPAGGERLRVSVRDTGFGIAAEALPRLFKPFERLESAYDGIAGSGIGLALAKKLVEAMHGEIGVESVPGEGSTFWFELPLAMVAEADSESAAIPTVVPNNRRKILYIEDNPANLKLVQKIIATRGNVELLSAVNAENGLEIAISQRPELILLDINLPGMGGFEALRKLKDDPVTRDIPVVAITANAMARDIERGKAAGFDDYLTKPLDVEHFIQTIERCLHRSPMRP